MKKNEKLEEFKKKHFTTDRKRFIKQNRIYRRIKCELKRFKAFSNEIVWIQVWNNFWKELC